MIFLVKFHAYYIAGFDRDRLASFVVAYLSTDCSVFIDDLSNSGFEVVVAIGAIASATPYLFREFCIGNFCLALRIHIRDIEILIKSHSMHDDLIWRFPHRCIWETIECASEID